ncbi:MAG: pyridoxamine 5'-phosphate oxidase [Thermoanaerobaculia bacterium]
MSPVVPIERFQRLFAEARQREAHDATAVTLATATPDGRPSARVVLLKQADERGFVFYTNLGSCKARELEANPRAALCFHWPALGRQVRVDGTVGRVDDAEADAYFAGRPRGSQLGAWVSRQSEPLASREELLARFRDVEARFSGGDVPRPGFWGGYRLAPERIEFWESQEDRLHVRTLYLRDGDGWRVESLYP